MAEDFWSQYVESLNNSSSPSLVDKLVPPSAPIGRSSLDEQWVSAPPYIPPEDLERMRREQFLEMESGKAWNRAFDRLLFLATLGAGPAAGAARAINAARAASAASGANAARAATAASAPSAAGAAGVASAPSAAGVANALSAGSAAGIESLPLTILRRPQNKPIEVWHGTGTVWPAEPGYPYGRFDPTKVGTGEGAAAYGHAPGGYWAESRRVAEDYRRRLSGPETHLIDNKPIDLMDPRHAAADLLYSKGGDHGAAVASVNEGIQKITAEIRDLYKILDDPRYEHIGQRSPILQSIDFREAFLSYKLNKLEEMRRALLNPEKLPTITVKRNEGALYRGRLDANPEEFFKWDIPLSAQSPRVQQAVRELPYGNTPWIWREESPMRALELARAYHLRHPQAGTLASPNMVVEVSQDLAKQGLSGISYWDAMSRLAQQGTKNHVIFKPGLVEILERYGLIPPAVIGAGAISKESSQ